MLHLSVHTYVHTCPHIYTCKTTHAHTHILTCSGMYPYMQSHVHTHFHACTHSHSCLHVLSVHVHTLAHTHTYTLTFPSQGREESRSLPHSHSFWRKQHPGIPGKPDPRSLHLLFQEPLVSGVLDTFFQEQSHGSK